MADNRGLLGDSWAFTEALGEGVWDAGTGTVKGLGDLAKGGYELATEANARESAWETTKQLADAAAEGRSAEFFGDMAGGALFEVGSILVPVGLVAKAGKLGKVASVADDVADAAKTAKKVENAEEVFGATQKAKAASVNPVIKEFDDKVSPIQRCPVADVDVDVGVKNVDAPNNSLNGKYSRRTNISYRDADDVNATFPSEWEPPYTPGTRVTEFTTTVDDVYVRVHGETNKARSWMMKREGVDGLTPQQIKSKYALPEIPTYASEVHVPSGTRVRTGKVNPVFDENGNATQYELLQRLPESVFKNTVRLEK
ncbi:MAG: hypothetical protein L3J75_01780 [Methylococcaceae bacterium]|nr:hypothetical protein [Methylococcaceae bacterium]